MTRPLATRHKCIMHDQGQQAVGPANANHRVPSNVPPHWPPAGLVSFSGLCWCHILDVALCRRAGGIPVSLLARSDGALAEVTVVFMLLALVVAGFIQGGPLLPACSPVWFSYGGCRLFQPDAANSQILVNPSIPIDWTTFQLYFSGKQMPIRRQEMLNL